MKVILIDEIRGLGSRGDVVTVKDGYARNFLIPKQLAREAADQGREARAIAPLGQVQHDPRRAGGR